MKKKKGHTLEALRKKGACYYAFWWMVGSVNIRRIWRLWGITVNAWCLLLHRFWLAVEDLKKRPIREVPSRVQEIWQEFLAPGAPSAINLDSKSYDKTTQNVKEPGRYTFEDAQVGMWAGLAVSHAPAPGRLALEILLLYFHLIGS